VLANYVDCGHKIATYLGVPELQAPLGRSLTVCGRGPGIAPGPRESTTRHQQTVHIS
jgi:hypothetical protein